jgi:ribosomal protein S25
LSDTEQLSFSANNGNQSDDITSEAESASPSSGEQLFATVRALLERLEVPKTDKEIANELNVKLVQAKEWIKRLVKEGVLEKVSKPTRYRSTTSSKLF